MKKLMVLLSLTTLLAQSASATSHGPRMYCRSFDEIKSVRVEPGPWGKMQAKIYHNGTIHQVLKCDFNTNGYLYRCTDDNDVARIFTVQHDGQTGLYEGSRESWPMHCRSL